MTTPKGLCYHVTYRNNAMAAEKEFKSDIDRLKKYVKGDFILIHCVNAIGGKYIKILNVISTKGLDIYLF